MYWRHFHLDGEPFSLTPDPAFLYLSQGHREALAALKIGLVQRRGLLAMVGEVGTGKTTLVYTLLQGLEDDIRTAYVSNTLLSFDGILRSALADFGLTPKGVAREDLLACLNDFLFRCAREDKTAALVIDEAQNLSLEAFEELRLLSNVETYTTKLLQIVLVGQPELAAKLKRFELRQLNERIAIRCHLTPLTEEESVKYIEHRLAAVGGSLDIFARPALNAIVRYADGIPRRINIICHNAMMFAYGNDAPQVTKQIALAAIENHEAGAAALLTSDEFDVRPPSSAWQGLRSGFAMTRWAAPLSLVVWLLAAVGIGAVLALAVGEITARTGRRDAAAPVVAPQARGVPAPAAKTFPPIPARESTSAADPTPASGRALVAAPAPRGNQAVDTKPPPLPARPASEATAATGAARTESVPATSSDLEAGSAGAPLQAHPAARSPEAAAATNPPVQASAASPPPLGDPAREPAQAVAPLPAPATIPGDDEPASVPAELAAVADEVEPRGQAQASQPDATATQPSPAPIERILHVPRGGTLSEVILQVYGRYDRELLERVTKANPHIVDPDVIRAGEEVRLPDSR